MAELGPPFGGITRIRFKGFVYDVSAIRLPRNLSREAKARRAEVNASKITEVRRQRSGANLLSPISGLPASSSNLPVASSELLLFLFDVGVENGHPRALLP